MKRSFLAIAVLCLFVISYTSYSLSNFSYTGIAFDGSGSIIASATNVTVRIQLIESGTIKYDETHSNVSTNQFGIYTITVGTGTVNSGSIGSVNATKNLRIKATTSQSGGTAGVWVVSSILKPNVPVTVSNSVAGSGSGSNWSLTGNSGTTPGTHFIGTTDSQEVRVEVRNSGTVQQSLRIGSNREIYRESGILGVTAGNARGQGAVDLQVGRTNAANVASGAGSIICGGSDNSASGLYAVVVGGSNNRGNGTGSFIGCGEHNKTYGLTSGIVGGTFNIANGTSSFIGAGKNDTTSGHYTVIGGGMHNNILDSLAVIGGGKQNSTLAKYSVIGGGSKNYITNAAQYSTIAGGFGAKADKYGQNAYAAGFFSNLGDAQTSVFVLRGATYPGKYFDTLKLDGNSKLLTLNNGDTWAFTVLLVGRSNSGTAFCYSFYTGLIRRNGTSTVLYGLQAIYGYNTGGLLHSINADDVNEALIIRVNSGGSVQVHWVARVELTQVNY